MADRTILIADDDDLICDLLSFVLEGAGYGIITAHTVEDIVRKINESKPDLTLLDLTLGDRSGVEVLKRIDGTQMPVIMLSGYDKSVLDESGATKFACVKDCLTKPISPETVAEAVKKTLG